MRSELLEPLAYWLSAATADEFAREPVFTLYRQGSALGARSYEVFGTANLFNFSPGPHPSKSSQTRYRERRRLQPAARQQVD
ncbi:MAG: hypothetical protein J2P21_02780 [Chloracidobacterium sp.]|nr:hypothetical protein [Chloracidobacterium sp.]